MPMIYCAECGSAASPKAPNCPKCGHPLQAAPKPAQPAGQPIVNVTVAQTQQVTQGVGGKRWSPLVAAILSFFIPGLGQLYKGQPINGLVWFVLVLVGYIALVVPGIILHIGCILGAGMGNPSK